MIQLSGTGRTENCCIESDLLKRKKSIVYTSEIKFVTWDARAKALFINYIYFFK